MSNASPLSVREGSLSLTAASEPVAAALETHALSVLSGFALGHGLEML